jgi:hypothetical protein
MLSHTLDALSAPLGVLSDTLDALSVRLGVLSDTLDALRVRLGVLSHTLDALSVPLGTPSALAKALSALAHVLSGAVFCYRGLQRIGQVVERIRRPFELKYLESS